MSQYEVREWPLRSGRPVDRGGERESVTRRGGFRRPVRNTWWELAQIAPKGDIIRPIYGFGCKLELQWPQQVVIRRTKLERCTDLSRYAV